MELLPKSLALTINDKTAHSYHFGELPLHVMIRAAVFLPKEIFKKGLDPHVVI